MNQDALFDSLLKSSNKNKVNLDFESLDDSPVKLPPPAKGKRILENVSLSISTSSSISSRREKYNVLDSKVKQGANFGSDHYLLTCEILLLLKE